MLDFLVFFSVGIACIVISISMFMASKNKKKLEDKIQQRADKLQSAQTRKPKESIYNILYLDEQKLRSFSSQLFAGFSEEFLKRSGQEHLVGEKVEFPIASGQVIAEILQQKSSLEEKKFLYDHAYELFEREAFLNNLIHDLDDCTYLPTNSDTVGSIVKISGTFSILDVRAVIEMLENYNSVGMAMTYVSNAKDLMDILEESGHGNRQQRRASGRSKINIDDAVKKLASESGLQSDEKYNKNLAYILKQFYGDYLEVDLHEDTLGKVIASAILNRDYLRDDQMRLAMKFGRFSQARITIVGVVSQIGIDDSKKGDAEADKDDPQFKETLRGVGFALHGVEKNFQAAVKDELVIDPIAFYSKIE